jgi:hypothetical protein
MTTMGPFGFKFTLVHLFSLLYSLAFVMCEYWSSVMFANEIVGTANGVYLPGEMS